MKQAKIRIQNGFRESDDGWGDSFGEKKEGHLRITSRNIGGLLVKLNNKKELDLKNWIKEKDIDIIGIQEPNINWSRCNQNERFTYRMRSMNWRFLRGATSHNKHFDSHSKSMFGGTITAAFEETAQTTTATGSDQTGLGRWSWIKIESKRFTTRIISVYKPNIVKDPEKPGAVYMQHYKYWMSKDKDGCPNEIFEKHLVEQVVKWRAKKEKIVLMIDMNEDVRKAKLTSKLEDAGLISPFRQKHGSNQPATFHLGSVPIDDIFVSRDIAVARAGYGAFGDGPGDHRPLFLDIEEDSILGEDKHTILRKNQRRLNSKLPHVVKKFNSLVKHQLRKNHYAERTFNLEQWIHYPARYAYVSEYEKLDVVEYEAFRYASERCRKLRMGAVAYAPEEIQVHGKTIHLWTLVLRRMKGCRVGFRVISSLAASLDIDNPTQVSIKEATANRAESWKKYKAKKHWSESERMSWLRSRRDQYIEDGFMEEAKKLDRQIATEETRGAHKKLQYVRGKISKGGTSKLTVPEYEGSSVMLEINDKEEMENVLMRTNEEKFRSAENTPLVCGHLFDKLGFRALNKVGDNILKGVEDISGEDEGVQAFLTHVAIPSEIRSAGPINTIITAQDHQKYWQKARESTQSSMSKMDFSYYKTITQDEELNRWTARMINIPFNAGFSPKRWRQSLNVHLLKKENDFRPEKQRTIHLIEASLSEGAKIIFSQRMMKSARKHNVIPPDQFAKKGSKVTEAALQKVLFYDYLRVTRKNGVIMANDMHSCYDRMVHSATSLALRSLGAPAPAVDCMSTSIQSMRHYIRTAYGDSDRFYGGDMKNPLQGGGQGNPAAPPMWTALTIVFLRILNSLCPGVDICSPISLLSVVFSAVMYVDDCDLFVLANDDELQDPKRTFERMQKMINMWCSILWASGGVLRPEKCWWCGVIFEWEKGKWKYALDEDHQFVMTAKDINEEVCTIRRSDVRTPEETLGIWCCANGDWDFSFQRMMEASQKWAAHMQSAYLTQYEALLSVTTTITKTWDYPIGVVGFTEKQCEQIMTPAYMKILPKIGPSTRLPLVYRYGPRNKLGLGLPHLYTRLGIEHIKLLITHMQSESKNGKLMETILEYANIELGTTKHVFELDYKKWHKLLTDSWVKVTWQFCWKSNIKIKGKYSRPKPPRINDEALMEMVMRDDRNLFLPWQIRAINRCRMYLQVIFLSDITLSDGKTVHPAVLLGKCMEDRVHRWDWPLQPRPPASDWRLFRKCMKLIWTKNNDYGKIEPVLGEWVLPPAQFWKYAYSARKDMIYEVQENRVVKIYEAWNYRVRARRSRLKTYKVCDGGLTESLPEDAVVVSTKWDDGPGVIGAYPAAAQVCENELDMNEQKRFHICFDKDGEYIADAIKRNDIIVMSDGSFSHSIRMGAAAMRMETKQGDLLAVGWTRTSGSSIVMDPYRAELSGILIGLETLQIICSKFNIRQGTVIVSCDNDTALERGIDDQWMHSVRAQHYDLLWEIMRIRNKLPLTLVSNRVKSHVSEFKCSKCQLSRMNSWVDKKAGEYLQYCIQNDKNTYVADDCVGRWSIWIGNQKLTKNIDHAIIDHIHGKALVKHLSSKNHIPRNAIQLVDWNSLEAATKDIPLAERIWAIKFSANACPVGEVMYWRKQWRSPNCPMCGNIKERLIHMFQCPHTTDARVKQLLNFSEWFDVTKTAHMISSTIIGALLTMSSFTENTPSNAPECIRKAAKEQDKIGMFGFLSGKITNAWVEAYSLLKKKSKRKYAVRSKWGAHLIKKTLSYTYQIWKIRSKKVHEVLDKVATREAHTEINKEIIAQYNKLIREVRARERFLLRLSVEEVVEMRLSQKRAWLDFVNTVLDGTKRVNEAQAVKMQRFMENWTAGVAS